MVQELSKTNTETTPIDAEDPDLTDFIVHNHMIVVRPLHVEGKTKGGLYLAGKTQHDLSYLMNVCKVLKLGKRAYVQDKFEDTGPWCEVGDYVLLPRLGGQKIKFKGVPLTLISCDQVMATIQNPADVDPNFNISTEGRL